MSGALYPITLTSIPEPSQKLKRNGIQTKQRDQIFGVMAQSGMGSKLDDMLS
jgi:hypothetical protein